MSWKKILCPVDFSEGAGQAQSVAVSMAKEAGAELVLTYVWQPPMYTMGEGILLAPDLITDLIADAEANLANRKATVEAQGIRVSTLLLTGAPWNEIVEAVARDPAIDLVVMGTHGRTGLRHALLGSVAEQVVRRAACPVLVVRTRSKTVTPRPHDA